MRVKPLRFSVSSRGLRPAIALAISAPAAPLEDKPRGKRDRNFRSRFCEAGNKTDPTRKILSHRSEVAANSKRRPLSRNLSRSLILSRSLVLSSSRLFLQRLWSVPSRSRQSGVSRFSFLQSFTLSAQGAISCQNSLLSGPSNFNAEAENTALACLRRHSLVLRRALTHFPSYRRHSGTRSIPHWRSVAKIHPIRGVYPKA